MERLQKIISSYGYTSRRKAEELITKGKVRVNGIVAKLGDKADKSYVDDNFATMDKVKDGYARILKNNDTDTNEAMFISYKNSDLFGIRIYKDDNSEHELRFSASSISYVKDGVTVWTK